jgi:beta-phosphoglucomutase-like phosphatase (HAD superfamily)
MGRRLKALLWDVDGTLAETEFEGHRHGFNLAFKEAGLPWHWDLDTYRGLLAVSGGRERLAAYRHQQGEAPWPREKLETLMPCQVAARKCPASCTTINRARIARAERTPIK